MKTNFYKSTGISLLLGGFLAIITMVLHPPGGSLEVILETAKPIKMAHALAITSLPFLLFGFYGLTCKLLDEWKLSVLALIIVAFGLISAMLAGLVNGLALPFFLESYSENFNQNKQMLEPVAIYGFAVNRALDYVFIVALCIGISIYSFLMLNLKGLYRWIGYSGLSILVFLLIGALSDFVFTNLFGFRIFVFAIAIWILCVGCILIKSRKNGYQ